MFRLAQSQLNLLTTCPRKFQQTYLEQLISPSTPEQQEKINWGTQFHLLMQQRELGLPVDRILHEDPELERSFTAFIDAVPEIFATTNAQQIFRQAEHPRTLKFQDYLLTVIYDLLIADPGQAKIFDWKTYPRPQQSKWIAQNWQTRLYLYVLVETSNYTPEQVSMTYWFVQLKDETRPQSLKFTYSQVQHEQTRQELTRILTQFTGWLQRYQDFDEPFPQLDRHQGECESCQFVSRCWSEQESEAFTDLSSMPFLLQDLGEIEEVSI